MQAVKRGWRVVVAGLEQRAPALHAMALRLQLRGMSTSRALKGHDIGEFTYGRPAVLDFGRGAALSIGKYTSIGGEVAILLGGEHPSHHLSTYPFSALWPEGRQMPIVDSWKGDVRIGNDVWIGQRVTILSGVTIGDGAVIGAGSVVTRDVPAYAVAAGNPCRVIRPRFKQDVIDTLLRLRWWDWPHDLVVRAIPLLASDDIEGLAELAARRDRKS